jgi:hypothetical protein
MYHERMLKAHPDTEAVAVAYVFIVEFRAKPDEVEPCAELIDCHAHNSRTLEEVSPAFDVCQGPQDPARFVF